jgi:hypothetical protein
MTDFEIENRIMRLSSDLSAKRCELAAIRCHLAGRQESYEQRSLIEADNCIAYMQMYAQRAGVALGETTPEPDPETVNAVSPAWWLV